MRIDRLSKFAKLLEVDAVNPNGIMFDLGFWAYPTDYNPDYDHKTFKRIPPYVQGEVIPLDCKTSACALGLLALSGLFEDEGFTYFIGANGDLYPSYKGHIGFDAAEAFFEFPQRKLHKSDEPDIAYLLFDSTYYHKSTGAEAELEVIKRINILIKNGTLNRILCGFYGD